MLGRRLVVLALTLASLPAMAAETREQAARQKALLAYQRDLVSVAAAQVDAAPLLGAALLARPLDNQPTITSYHGLIERAAQAPDAGPEVQWGRLADCDTRGNDCPNVDAVAKLVAMAPDNAAVWLLKLDLDLRDGHHDDARADLASAASAKLYDDYAGATFKALASVATVLPPPAATLPPLSPSNGYGVQMVLVFGVGGAQLRPGLPAIAKLCEDNPELKDNCLKLGKTLEWGSSPLARSLGLHLREVLSDDPAQQQDAQRARHNLAWQVQHFAQLGVRAQNDDKLARHLLLLASHGGTEMSLMLTALHDTGIPVDAPVEGSADTAASSP